MSKSLRALIVEDSEDDLLLLVRELRRGGYDPDWRRVDSAEDMRSALDSEQWDIVFSDYSMPNFSAVAALEVLTSCSIDLPFIIVSGTIGEQTAVEAMKAGAHDFLRKDQLARLLPAVDRELRDAQERRTAREIHDKLQLAQAQAVAQERLAAVGQMAAGIAHDFNNLLGTIILYAELVLKSSPLIPADEDRMHRILEQAKHGASLVSQILDFSRRSMIDRAPMDVIAFLQDLERLLARTMPENIRIRMDLDEGPFVIHADKARLQQVFVNLALNARDAMPEGGELNFDASVVEVGVETNRFLDVGPGSWVRIGVADTGTGIPEEILARVFEPFFTTKEPGKGSGLGLSQVYGIIKQHEGATSVESREGEGTLITILLPLSAERSVPDLIRTDTGSLGGRGEVILLVEDEAPLREAIGEALSAMGYRVLQAADGNQALEKLESRGEAVRLVLTDKVMPGISGVELYRHVRRLYPEMPVLLMSAYSQDEHTRELVEGGGLVWIQKPVNTEALAHAVHELLSRPLKQL